MMIIRVVSPVFEGVGEGEGAGARSGAGAVADGIGATIGAVAVAGDVNCSGAGGSGGSDAPQLAAQTTAAMTTKDRANLRNAIPIIGITVELEHA